MIAPNPTQGSTPAQITLSTTHQIKESFSPETIVNLASRTAEVFFASGVIFSSIAVTSHASAIVTGSSFLIHGSFIIIKLLETAICFDLTKIAANIASIYDSNVLRSWVDTRLGGTAKRIVEEMESFLAPPKTTAKDRKSWNSFIPTLTHGTLLAHHINPYIIDWLNKKSEENTP